MKKTVFAISAIAVAIIFVIAYICYLKSIDTVFAVKFSEVFTDYNISDIDKYFSNDTIIICSGKKDTYKNLRTNVVTACGEKRYSFADGSSYGCGDDKFTDGTQTVNITLFGKLDGKDIGECNISMRLKKSGFFKFKIDTVSCDAPIFEYLFYAKQATVPPESISSHIVRRVLI